MSISKKITLCIITTAVVVTILFLIGLYAESSAEHKENLILKSYKNTVALYDGSQLITVYNDIVLNTLPQSDIIKFNSGIRINNATDLEKILEDYDS